MKSFLKKLFLGETNYDSLVEGIYADQYPEEEGYCVRTQIRNAYRQKWPEPNANPTPATHPWMYDPCDPPKGWRYDPYYEYWIKINE